MTTRSLTLAPAPARRVGSAPSLVVLLGLAACASPPPPAGGAPTPTTPTTPAAAEPAAAPPGSATVGTASDWNAQPTNGSPGVDAPKLSGHELLGNTTFEGGKYVPWTTSFTAPGAGSGFVKDGQFCVLVTNKGKDPWDAQMRHREMVIQKGHTYSLRYTAHATKPIQMKAKVGMSGPPYKEYWADTVDLTTHPQTFVGVFTMEEDDDPTAELAFHFGGPNAGETQPPYTVCFDDMHLDDPKFVKAAGAKEEAPIPNVTVNQTGYLPGLPKLATVKSASTAPLKWELHKHGGGVVASGESKPFGKDAASGEDVHLVDFSSVTTPGKDYTLKVGNDTSHPFDIGADVYKKLKYDALAIFYHQRSGIPIAMPYAGGKQWTRPAGHVNVKAFDPVKDSPNTGDKAVPCLKDSGCDYTLDVTRGWYDAGDHGKYVVNGGIAAWTLMNQYERAQERGTAGDFGDGKMNIPEKKNKVPDILDEARWEMEFMLAMQVPDGKPKAGMVHHKIHDKEWTALGTRPDQDAQPRFLWPPSTAATLNLAATAAQCARVFAKLDKKFSARCLAAAEKAWPAAVANPAVFAGTAAIGGGPYDDTHVDDEFYWAAAELYATTKKDAYKTFLEKSPHYKKVPAVDGDEQLPTPMTWGSVSALGTITLAVVPNGLAAKEIDDCKAAIKAAADSYVAIVDTQGYRVPFKPGKKGFPWGSNSFVLNNALVMGLAGDFTGDVKYRNAVAEGMNYILGRNPLDKSYVTGYGERPLENPHHRFWAHQANAKFPSAPPGVVSGGPNSGLQDPYVQAAGLAGCAPQKCFVDNIEAWSANEMAINWNAPLAWVAAYLDEHGSGRGAGKAKGKK
ncbi:MAG TPA: glycoside hydrolase family 9 protein [Polyangia bacterium]|jgi:endoglucanase